MILAGLVALAFQETQTAPIIAECSYRLSQTFVDSEDGSVVEKFVFDVKEAVAGTKSTNLNLYSTKMLAEHWLGDLKLDLPRTRGPILLVEPIAPNQLRKKLSAYPEDRIEFRLNRILWFVSPMPQVGKEVNWNSDGNMDEGVPEANHSGRTLRNEGPLSSTIAYRFEEVGKEVIRGKGELTLIRSKTEKLPDGTAVSFSFPRIGKFEATNVPMPGGADTKYTLRIEIEPKTK